MTTGRFTLPKEERLSRKRDVDQLFAKGRTFVAFPLRVIYLIVKEEFLVPSSFLVSVSKKRFKRAVDRNRVKRQMREAYRVRKHELLEVLTGSDRRIWIAFLYMDKEIYPQVKIEKAMEKAIQILRKKLR